MKTRIVVAVIVLIYNILGFIAILGLYPGDPFFGERSIFLLLITFPITIITSLLRYSDSSLILPLAVQTIILLLSLFIADMIVKAITKKKD